MSAMRSSNEERSIAEVNPDFYDSRMKASGVSVLPLPTTVATTSNSDNSHATDQTEEETKVDDSTEEEVREKIITQLHKMDRHLYDRASEQHQLIEAYRKSRTKEFIQGRSNFVLITGEEGTGKSALAHALRKVVKQDGGYIISGRFDQNRSQPAEPYKAFVESFSDWSNQVVEDGNVDAMRSAVDEYIEAGGKVLTDMIPALKQIVGEQEDLLPGQARGGRAIARFLFVFRRFLRAITSEKSIVLILENIHFADPCSLELLTTLASDLHYKGLLLVCTCLGAALHEPRLQGCMEKLKEANVRVKEIKLQNLSEGAVNDMLADLLTIPLEKSLPLARVLRNQTNGNAVFVIETIRQLHEEGLLAYDLHLRCWSWDTNAVQTQFKVSNLADFLFERIQQIPSQVKELLKVASCLGSKLDETMLSHALSAPVGHYLTLACERGLLKLDKQTKEYWFAHDGIQAACYKLIPEDSRPAFHLAIGRRLWRQLDMEELEKQLFVVLDQLQRGKALINNGKEKYLVADLCLQGARRAVMASSFRAAAACLTFGVDMLQERRAFIDQYDLWLAIHSTATEVYYVVADTVRMQKSIDTILSNARSLKDKLSAYTTHVYALGSSGRGEDAVDEAHRVLEELGCPIPKEPGSFKIMRDSLRVKKMLVGRTHESILRMHRMVDENSLAVMQMLNVLFLNSYMTESKAFPLIGLKMVELTLESGLCAASAFGFAIYGFMMSVKDFDEGFEFGMLALKVVDVFKAKEWVPRVYVLVYGCLYPWKKPMKEGLSALHKAHFVGIESGDHEYAMLCCNIWAMNSIEVAPMDGVAGECIKFYQQMTDSKQHAALAMMELFQQVLAVFMGEANYINFVHKSRSMISTDALGEHRSNDMMSAMYLYERLLVTYTFHDVTSTGRISTECWNRIKGKALGSYEQCSLYFYCGLASALVAHRSLDEKQLRSRKKVLRTTIKAMRRWSIDCPHCCSSKLFLLQAESAAIEGDNKRAVGKYLCAIAMGSHHGLLLETAIATECAARFFLSRGDQDEALRYLKDALEAWEKTGAYGKVEHFRQEFDLLHEGMLSGPS